MCKVYTGYYGTSEIEHSLCTCTVDNLLAKARGLSLRTGAQTMLYLSLRISVKIVLVIIRIRKFVIGLTLLEAGEQDRKKKEKLWCFWL